MSVQLPGFAGDLGRVTLWPFAMSAGRAKASYRQQNNLAQWVGISGENASSDTNRAPTAVPVQEELTSGVAKTIPVISRAYDPDGDALSIVSGSLTPSNGAASIVSDQVVWTPPSSFVGAGTCDFTLRDGGGKTSASKIYATVAAPTVITDYPKWPMDFTDWRNVPVSRIRPVGFGVSGAPGPAGGYTSLANAYAAAVVGDFIVLNDGTFAGGFTFNRDFGGNGIAIVGRNIANGRDPLTIMPGQYTVSGDGHWFHHLRLTRGFDTGNNSTRPYQPFICSSQRNYWTRNWFTGPQGIWLENADGTHDNAICYNRWSTTITGGGTWIGFMNKQITGSSLLHRNTIIARNYMLNDQAVSYNNAAMIHCNSARPDPGPNKFWYFKGFKIEQNLLIVTATAGFDKAIYIKHGVESFKENTILGPTTYLQRHGSIRYSPSNDTASTMTIPKYHLNYFGAYGGVKSRGVAFNGCGIDFRGNYIDSSDVGVELNNGWQFDNDYEAMYQAASDFLAVGNLVKAAIASKTYQIGAHGTLKTDNGEDGYASSQGYKIRNVNIWGHKSGTTAGSTTVDNVGQLFYNGETSRIMTSTCSFQAGFGSYANPGLATQLSETDVGFQVPGQSGKAA